MRTRVVTISVDATADGTRLFVQGALISLGINAIPEVTLTCAPSDKGKHTPLEPNVAKPRISDYANLYNKLAAAAECLDKSGSVSIKITDDLGYSESLSLNGWVLAGVGLSDASASAAPYLSVILQHPICKLTKVGSIYETPKSSLGIALDRATSGKSKFLDIVDAAYTVAKKGQYWPAPTKFPPMFRAQLGTGDFAPKKYLEERSNGLFLQSAGKEKIAQAIGRMVMPSYSSSSTWDMLMSSCGALMLNITQDESANFTTDKLVLEPVQKWKTPSISLYDEECFSTDLPGGDPFKVAGVMCNKAGPYNDKINLGLIRNGNIIDKDPSGQVLYVPDGVTPSTANGRIMMVQCPKILDSAFRRDAPSKSKYIVLSEIILRATRMGAYNECLKKYCKAVYESTAASMVQAKAVMALWFKDMDGKLILPGNTCKFVSEGKTIYHGLINRVVHNMSTSGGNSTVVMMTNVRPEASYKVGETTAISSGSPNAAYT